MRMNPFKTDKIVFSVYNFQPWQALSMHMHPGNDEVFYVIDRQCLFYVGDERRAVDAGHAVYVKAGTMHAVLSCGKSATLLSVQGPEPVSSIYGKGLEYFCPECGLEAPAAAGTKVTTCPRCRYRLKLTPAGEAFEAETIEGEAPTGARA